MDLPVPVEGLVEPLAGGRRVQEQVVRRIAERVERVERALERGRGIGDGVVVERREVGGVLARGTTIISNARAAGGRREDDGVMVGEHEPLAALLLGLGQARTTRSAGA